MAAPINVLNLGAGVQSSTILLLSCHRLLPKLDAAIFADTGWEPRAVYEHLAWLATQARRSGIPLYVIGKATLRADAIVSQVRGRATDGKRWASMPLFVRNADGSIGRIKRQCTSEYKVRPIQRFIRREVLGLAPGQRAPLRSVRQWFGISADEARRARASREGWSEHVYPLLNLPDAMLPRPWNRADCLAWLTATHPGRAFPKSACLGCPFHSDGEWRRLRRDDPEGWEDVIAFDAAIRHPRGMREKAEVFLHRSARPLAAAVLDEGPSLFAGECDAGYCAV